MKKDLNIEKEKWMKMLVSLEKNTHNIIEKNKNKFLIIEDYEFKRLKNLFKNDRRKFAGFERRTNYWKNYGYRWLNWKISIIKKQLEKYILNNSLRDINKELIRTMLWVSEKETLKDILKNIKEKNKKLN